MKFGKIVGFDYLTFKINALQKPSARVDFGNLGKDFFLVRFFLEGKKISNPLANTYSSVTGFRKLRNTCKHNTYSKSPASLPKKIFYCLLNKFPFVRDFLPFLFLP